MDEADGAQPAGVEPAADATAPAPLLQPVGGAGGMRMPGVPVVPGADGVLEATLTLALGDGRQQLAAGVLLLFGAILAGAIAHVGGVVVFGVVAAAVWYAFVRPRSHVSRLVLDTGAGVLTVESPGGDQRIAVAGLRSLRRPPLRQGWVLTHDGGVVELRPRYDGLPHLVVALQRANPAFEVPDRPT